MKKTIVLVIGLPLTLIMVALSMALAFGGPATPPPMPSINDPVKSVKFADMPTLSQFTARDGVRLAYRKYAPSATQSRGSVVLIHGSSSSSSSMHPMAKAFAEAGYWVFALDMRGHGASGTKGRISYVGQLEDDLQDFVKLTSLAKPSTLAGFSAGGGFAMRFAGSSHQQLFQNYVFLSPFISQDAPTDRPSSGGWVRVGVPRIVALSILNAAGIRAFNDLPVSRFALSEEAKSFLTPEYTFALASNFRPRADYAQDIKAIEQPSHLIAGERDEVFFSERFADVIRATGKPIPVTLVPDVGHIQLTLQESAIATTIRAVEAMRPNGV